jgi:hypothetical protein
MDGKPGLERGNGKELERRTGIGNEEKKGKGIIEKTRNWDWKKDGNRD